MIDTSKNKAAASRKNVPTAELAAGLIWADRKWLIFFYFLLLMPSFVLEFINRSAPGSALFLSVTERGLELLFLFILTSLWAKRLHSKKIEFTPRQALRFFAFGYSLWALLIFPPVLISSFNSSLAPGLQALVYAAFSIPGLILAYRYFMYFFPMLFTQGSFRDNLAFAASFLVQDRYLPFKILAAPAGLSSLLMSLCAAPYPDGRILSLSLLSNFFGGLLWVLSSYLGLAFAILALTDKRWRELGLDPYREARCTTIIIGAPNFLSSVLSVKNGIRLLLISIFIWMGNYTRLELLAPAASIEIIRAEALNDQISMEIEVHDPRYSLRAFKPLHFRLAGENYLEGGAASSALIANYPIKASSKQKGASSEDLRFFVAPTNQPLRILLLFKASRSGEALTALEDLYLWYRHAKIIPVKLIKSEEPAFTQEKVLAP